MITTAATARTSADLAAFRAREAALTLRNLRRAVAGGAELSRHDAARLRMAERASELGLVRAFRMAIGG